MFIRLSRNLALAAILIVIYYLMMTGLSDAAHTALEPLNTLSK